MRRFAELFESLDTTTSTNAKLDALRAFFAVADPSDAAWAVYVLIGRRVKRSVGPALLREWLVEAAALPSWLVDETYGSIGDLAETIALLVPRDGVDGSAHEGVSLTEWFNGRILPLAAHDVEEKRRQVVGWWRELPYRECFLVNKLLTGALRVGVSRSLVTRALADCLRQPRIQIERALIGDWHPGAEFWLSLVRNEGNLEITHPYPFYLASPLEVAPGELGLRDDWLAEWKWDGIRGQIVRRGGSSILWSRGEEIITERFPEIVSAAAALPDGTVLDGEVLAWRDDRVLPFAQLQQRIGRSKLTAKILAGIPARFLAYDLLEFDGEDWRPRPLRERRARLEILLHEPLAAPTAAPPRPGETLPLPGLVPGLVPGCVPGRAPGGATSSPVVGISPALPASSWEALALLRDEAGRRGVEGVMLKRWDAPYGTGRQRGAWWKWKIDPFVFDGVLLYAAPGHGRRSNLYTDYTFGVWDGDALVPVAKAYSGLTDAEIRDLDRWIRANTREKFGTVRSVEPRHVFELAYEGIANSPRHKSGVALRFPRILKWRTDKPIAEADRLASLRAVLEQSSRHDADR